jgi:hypothetical protein
MTDGDVPPHAAKPHEITIAGRTKAIIARRGTVERIEVGAGTGVHEPARSTASLPA